MGRVSVLPDSLINKIAAGEVIERPASVIKELVENSLDAGAGRIEVQVEGGGRALLRVVDDGCGMGREDARTCLERHATSKIRSDADLFAINTLGFRGEALPSIAEVSRFELITGERGADAGTRLVLDGGVWERIEDAPNPGGTEICVRRLFFNTPVRLKFLKAPRTELTHIGDVVQRMALAQPDVAFRLEVDGRQTLDLPVAGSLRSRAAKVLGKRTVEQMSDMGASQGAVRVEGLIGRPSLHRSGNGSLYLYVNGRFVKDRMLVGAVLAAYRGLLPPGRYPIAVLFVDVPPDEVDVNVHPTKVDVRFQNGRDVFRFLGAALTEALAAMDTGEAPSVFGEGRGRQLTLGAEPSKPVGGTPPLLAEAPPVIPTPPIALPKPPPSPSFPEPLRTVEVDPLGFAARPPGLPPALRRGPAIPAPAWSGRPPLPLRTARRIGTYGVRWILAEAGGELLVVDAAAAHRRILFDRLTAGDVPRQRLLVPELLELDEGALVAHEEALAAAGLEVSAFGGGTVALHAVPRGAHPQRCRGAVVALAARLPDARDPVAEVAAALAAWLGLDADRTLAEPEQRLLLGALAHSPAPHVDPWGGPVLGRFGPDEVARWPRA